MTIIIVIIIIIYIYIYICLPIYLPMRGLRGHHHEAERVDLRGRQPGAPHNNSQYNK